MHYKLFLLFFIGHGCLHGMQNDNSPVPPLKLIAAGAVIEYEPKQAYDFTRLPEELCKYVKDTYDLIEQVRHTVPPILGDPGISESKCTFLKPHHKRFLAWKKMHDEWRDVTFSEDDLKLVKFVKEHADDIEDHKDSPYYEKGKVLREILEEIEGERGFDLCPLSTDLLERHDLFMPLMAITPFDLRKILSRKIAIDVDWTKDNVDRMKIFLERGFKDNCIWRGNSSVALRSSNTHVLHEALYKENARLIYFLAEKGVFFNIIDGSYKGFLQKKYKTEIERNIFRYLQKKGAITENIEECVRSNEQLLFEAIKSHNYDLVKELVTQDILLSNNPSSIPHDHSFFYNVLTVLNKNNEKCFDILSLLITSKRFPNKYKCWSLLNVAEEKGYTEYTELLKERIAEKNRIAQEKEKKFNIPSLKRFVDRKRSFSEMG